jgi:hypothetical protein
VRAEREPDALRDLEVVGDLVERSVERLGAVAQRLIEQVLLRLDVRVERALLDAERLREITDRRPVVPALCEQSCRRPG